MSNNSVTKTVYYLRAIRNETTIDLKDILQNARTKYNTVSKSEKKLSSGDTIRIQHYKTTKKNDSVFIHLSRYTSGQKALTLGRNTDLPEDNEKDKDAGKDREFKNGDSFLLIDKHNVFFCSNNISLVQTTNYINIITRDKKEEKHVPICLIPTANISKLELIQSQGIKEISLSICAYDLSMPKQQKTSTSEFLKDALSALIKKDHSPSELKAMQDIIVGASIKLNGASKAPEISKNLINSIAEEMIDDLATNTDKYVITTMKDEKITPSQIRLQSKIKVNKEGNSVNYIDVRDALTVYMEALKSEGLLEK